MTRQSSVISTRSSALFWAVLCVNFFGTAHPVFALTLGDVFCHVADNTFAFVQVFNYVSYAAGAFTFVAGILGLKGHYENPNEHKMHRVFAQLVIGAFMLILPSVTGLLVDTIFTGFENGNYNTGSCLGAAQAASSGRDIGLDTLMINLVRNIRGPLTYMMFAIAGTMGVYLIVRGLLKAAKYGTDPRAHSVTNILTSLIIGAVLVVLSQSIDMIMSSVIGVSNASGGVATFDDVSWTAIDSLGGNQTHFKAAMKAALTFFQLVGLISFVRGWNVIRNSVEGTQQATFAQGLTHIIGGVLAMNIYMFIEFMNATFGTNFVS